MADFQKGKLYMLRNLTRNTRYNRMMDHDGTLYITDRPTRTGPTFTDGEVFVCLEDSPEFDVEAFRDTLSPHALEYHRLVRTAEAKAAYDQHRTVTFLTPAGSRARMRVKGNKTKFKAVTSRTRVK